MLPAISDTKIHKATGKDWRAWRCILDAWGASDRGNAASVRYLGHYHGLSASLAEAISARYADNMRLRAQAARTG